jgi:hypothetical protein
LDELVRGIWDYIGKKGVEQEMRAAVVDELAAETDSVYDRGKRVDVLEPETQKRHTKPESVLFS